MALNPVNGLLVYTDGAYSPKGPGGWAWVAVDIDGNEDHRSGYVPPPTTNNRMELIAVYSAMDDLHKLYGPIEMEIVSDSSYAVLGAMYPERKRNVNRDLWDRVDAGVAKHRHVQFRHIRGHVGVKYNELADTLAVEAKRKSTWQPPVIR
jgi:ribonuclease HI